MLHGAPSISARNLLGKLMRAKKSALLKLSLYARVGQVKQHQEIDNESDNEIRVVQKFALVHDERVCIRLFVGFGKAWRSLNLPDVIVLEGSEIASMSIRTVEVLVYGPKPRIVEWLMIEPTQAAAKSLSDQIPSFLADNRSPDFWTPYLGERLHWANDDRRFAIGWKMCRPALRVFLQQVARECPSIVVGPEESSELDLNGIWHGVRGGPNPEQRLMLVEARRLGFGPDCTTLLNRYRGMPYREIGAFWAEIQREEAATRQ